MNNEGQQNKEHISTEEFSNTRTSTMLQNKNTTFKKNPTNPQPNVLQGNCFFLYKHTYSQDIFKKKITCSSICLNFLFVKLLFHLKLMTELWVSN